MKRDCGTCGTNRIPYPLSTRPDCGDPMYTNFTCDRRTGQVNFGAYGRNFQVTNINTEERIFSIHIINCTNTDEMENLLQLNQSSVYQVSSGCSSEQSKLTLDIWFPDGRPSEVKIQWNPPPLPPVCDTSGKCTDWPHSSCNTKDGQKRCICDELYHWDSQNFTCTLNEGTVFCKTMLGFASCESNIALTVRKYSRGQIIPIQKKKSHPLKKKKQCFKH